MPEISGLPGYTAFCQYGVAGGAEASSGMVVTNVGIPVITGTGSYATRGYHGPADMSLTITEYGSGYADTYPERGPGVRCLLTRGR